MDRIAAAARRFASSRHGVIAVVLLAMLAACRPAAPNGQLAASVDGIDITVDAVDMAAGELGSTPPGKDQRQIALDALITQAALVEAALTEQLDRDARINEKLESARRKILAQAYIERHTADLPPPSTEAIQAYFDAHPELFSRRRIYRLQEIAIEAPAARLPSVIEQYERIGTLNDMVAWLEANGLRYTRSAAVRPAEDLPGDFVQALTNVRDGDTVRLQTNAGTTIIQVTGIEEAPVTLQQATPAITRYLANQNLAAAAEAIGKLLRERANIEYHAPFAPSNEATAR
jgi:EpsD family peptidyl-prolyl cis-trans isomerase